MLMTNLWLIKENLENSTNFAPQKLVLCYFQNGEKNKSNFGEILHKFRIFPDLSTKDEKNNYRVAQFWDL